MFFYLFQQIQVSVGRTPEYGGGFYYLRYYCQVDITSVPVFVRSDVSTLRGLIVQDLLSVSQRVGVEEYESGGQWDHKEPTNVVKGPYTTDTSTRNFTRGKVDLLSMSWEFKDKFILMNLWRGVVGEGVY